jgi:putative colanic acid biosynthesis UDP-glucose lipid carrier transferase
MLKERRGYGFLIKWLVIFGDVILINVLFIAVYHWTKELCTEDFYSKVNTIFLLLNINYWLASYFVPDKLDKPVLFTDKVVQHAIALVALHGIIFTCCLFFLRLESDFFPVRLIIYYYVALFFFLTLWRVIARETLKKLRQSGKNLRQVVIVGAGKNGRDLYAEMKKELSYGFHVHGFFDDNILLKDVLPNYLGMTHEVEDFALKNHINAIYCTLPNSQDEKIVRMLNFAEKYMIRFYLIPEFSRYVKKRLKLESMESMPVMAVRSEPLQFVHNQIIKRTFDLVLSALFICTLFPFLYLIIGALIKLSSPGSIIFKQERTGLYGNNFYCYKFRSMQVNAVANEKQAEKNDPRITRIGRFLRHSNLDELPQFINVLKGDMSIVGPRPHMLKHTQLYSELIDKYMVRHLVKPGITGWAQISGYRGETRTIEQMERRVRADVWYLENWTFLLDLKIVFVTIINTIRGDKRAF